MCGITTPELKSGRRRGMEVSDGGQVEREERRRGSRSTTSATNLGTRIVTRGRKKMLEASNRNAQKSTGRTAQRTRRAPSGDGERRASGPSGAECGGGNSYSGNAVTDRSEANSHRSPNVTKSGQPTKKASTPSPPKRRPTTSSSPRTPCLSKRGARSKIPSTPDTPSTSGGLGKQRVLVSPLLRTENLPDLEVLHRTEEQILQVERLRSVEWFLRSSDSRVAAAMCGTKTPALKSGRRRSNEVTNEGQTQRMERRRGSRSSTSATDLGTRMVTRGRKKMLEASVREVGHHGEASTSTVVVDVVVKKKNTGKTARRNRRAPSGDGDASGPSGADCGQADSYSGNAVTDRSEANSHRSPKVKKTGQPVIKASQTSPPKRTPTTSSSPRTPCLSKRGARSKIPSTPDTPSTSGGSGNQRLLVLPRTEEDYYTGNFPKHLSYRMALKRCHHPAKQVTLPKLMSILTLEKSGLETRMESPQQSRSLKLWTFS
ncbi:hypothetical protein T07_9436 [Trichinella nelsoni]|uniref:Uncharacterized protein n=1 Tax=Trichinella nelsoni TaxID=6336 RepID=A0A0V0RLB2_9BILA|nr:hypothetical protein T07_9436 [Trichinella nelsoni]